MRRKRFHRGVEVVEAALTLPLLTIALFGMLEITHRWHVEKMLKMATHEAMKAGAEVDGNSTTAEETFDEHALALGINDAQLIVGPSVSEFDNAEPGQVLILTGVAPKASNRLGIPSILPGASDLSGGTITYWRESL